MSKRMIDCPECKGDKSVMRSDEIGNVVVWDCTECWGSGRIPDRRSPTASDRAVERIKDQCEAQARQSDDKGGFISGAIFAAEQILYIIRKEAERG